MGAAFAQAPAAPVGAPTQGQAAYPLANPTAYVNNNNNYQAPALPGPLANPTPGTVVVHINGKVQTTFQSEWTTGVTRDFVAPAADRSTPSSAATAPGPSRSRRMRCSSRGSTPAHLAPENLDTNRNCGFVASSGPMRHRVGHNISSRWGLLGQV